MVVIDNVNDNELYKLFVELGYTGWQLILCNNKLNHFVLGGYYDNYDLFKEEMNLGNADAGFIIFKKDEYKLWDVKIKTNKSLSAYTVKLLGKIANRLDELDYHEILF